MANLKKLVWKCAFRNFVTCIVLQLSTFSGIDEENLKDPSTHQKQVVNRITTLVRPLSLWSPVNSSSINPSAVEATARWQTAHGKLKNQSTLLFINLKFTKGINIDCHSPNFQLIIKPGGYSQENWVGVCVSLPKTLTLFMTKICDIPYRPYPIYDLTKNSNPNLSSKSYFRPAL